MSKTPKLRFKEFSGDWEEKKLGTLGQFLKGSILSKADLSEEGKPCVLYGELYTKYSEVIKNVISKTNLENDKLVLGKKNDVLIPSSGETAIDIATASCLQQDNVILGGDLNVFRSDKVNGVFTSYQLNSSKKREIARLSQGASVVHIYNDQLKKIKLSVPSKEEQEKIASFFSLIDDKISLQGEKVEALKDYKTGMMQKIFSRELRFKDDDGRDYPEWEEKKFKDFTKINQGLQIPISERYTTEGENRYFYITNEFLKSDSETKYYIENPSESVICYEDDILMTRTGNTGKVVTGVKGAFHNNFFKIAYDKEKYDRMFLYYILTSHKMQKNIIRLAGSSTIPDLNHSDFYNIKVKLPIIEEQKKIADLLIRLDSKISKEQEKLDSLNEYKKGLLQQMFV